MSAISRLSSKERLCEDRGRRTWQDDDDVRSGNKKGSERLFVLVIASIITTVFSVCVINESYNRTMKWMSPSNVQLEEHSNSYWQKDISWTPCGDNIECGRLEVPLDYFNTSLGNASLALARYPATNKSERIGTILTNPGGPGVSGVNYIYRAGRRLSDMLDGKFDIVSWDPRGVNGTLPRVECFASETDQDIAFANIHGEVLPEYRNLSDPLDYAALREAVKIADSRNKVFVKLCQERSGETLKHVGTATVVRDLVRLYDVLEGEGKPVNFWGFSYGTVVGSYFVNMFPDRVGKVILDGNANPHIWANMHAYTWPKYYFKDSEKVLNNFYAACADAGPERCALASHRSTALTISDDVDALIAKLYNRPLAVTKSIRPGILTSSMIEAMIFTYLYRPREWPILATHLTSAMAGNGTSIVEMFMDKVELNTTVPVSTSFAIYAVTCVDNPDFSDFTEDEAFEDMLHEMALSQQQTSRHFAPDINVCHHWKARETERFTGPFNHTLSNEILVIGNTADPITPLENAIAVNEMMPHSSRLIIQDGSGHCSSAMISLCTSKAIKEYFVGGKLPPNGLMCSTDEKLFPPKDSASIKGPAWLKSSPEVYSVEDMKLLESSRALGLELEHFTSSFMRPRSLRQL